jgi:hypothetical protein
MVAAEMGRSPFDANATRTIDVRIARSDGGLEARLSSLEGDQVLGERSIADPDPACGELARAVALAISIAIDPLSFRREQPPPAKTTSVARAAPPAEPPPPLAEASAFGIGLGAGLLGAAGATPGITGGLWIEARAEWPVFTIGLEGRADLPTRIDLGARSGARVFLAAAFLSPCVHYGWFAGCAALGAGALYASGQALEDAQSTTSVYASLGARAVLRIPLVDALDLLLRAEIAAVLARTTLVVGEEEVWTSPPVAGTVGAGVLVRIL